MSTSSSRFGVKNAIIKLRITSLYPWLARRLNFNPVYVPENGIVLGCFAFFVNHRNLRALQLEDLLVFVETRQTLFATFVRNMAGDGYSELRESVLAFKKALRPNPDTAVYDSLQKLYDLRYGVRFLAENYDLFDELGYLVYRGPLGKFMDNFLTYSAQLPEIKMARFRQVLDEYQDDLAKFGFDKEAFKNATGIDYPDVEYPLPGEIGLAPGVRGRGYAPDFNLFDDAFIGEYIYPGNGLGARENANIRIKMSGNYDEDFRRAIEVADIPASDIPSGKLAPEGFVWHHLDDFDPIDGTCTMQLVRRELHNDVVKAPAHTGVSNKGTEHAGACAIWKRFYDIVGYDY